MSTIATDTFRTILVGFFVWSLIYHEVYSYYIQQLWTYLLTFRVVHWDTFEPFLSGLSFTIFVNIFRICDQFIPYLHKYRIENISYSNIEKKNLISKSVPKDK